jgi:hypothetical protein
VALQPYLCDILMLLGGSKHDPAHFMRTDGSLIDKTRELFCGHASLASERPVIRCETKFEQAQCVLEATLPM